MFAQSVLGRRVGTLNLARAVEVLSPYKAQCVPLAGARPLSAVGRALDPCLSAALTGPAKLQGLRREGRTQRETHGAGRGGTEVGMTDGCLIDELIELTAQSLSYLEIKEHFNVIKERGRK
ncbi:hypothetical protein ANANG_G00228030 [Anguilla anguilla]|uniref:Uncharacterized protein n=1 Tax=Anguilla anguilla TaxID=7936 RepID=A0A9D3LZ89_ANGAN|nr:hypothetical protein ANANG_G00228030 [Anguilla anguilla]